ncbi:MAG TPA: hypothetical protein PLY51_07310, partial [Microthrixaceae bacterium]|nr:hypothetical protein [Microthrixaceae bacterium]
MSVRLPVQIGKAPLLVAPGESPNPSNSFRIAFLRLVPDFVMNPATHEVSARSDAPVNPALQVRETGPGYAREHWLFGRFPEMGQHPEIHAGVGAETTGSSSPL